MKQNEMMLRLVEDGKIVGRMWLQDGKILQTHNEYTFWTPIEICITECHVIPYDSLELGIKVNNEWYFSGDVFEYQDEKYTLIYTGEAFELDPFKFGAIRWYIENGLKLIGTIHEERKK